MTQPISCCLPYLQRQFSYLELFHIYQWASCVLEVLLFFVLGIYSTCFWYKKLQKPHLSLKKCGLWSLIHKWNLCLKMSSTNALTKELFFCLSFFLLMVFISEYLALHILGSQFYRKFWFFVLKHSNIACLISRKVI